MKVLVTLEIDLLTGDYNLKYRGGPVELDRLQDAVLKVAKDFAEGNSKPKNPAKEWPT